MRLSLNPAPRACVVCERPAQPYALVCDYCGENLPERGRRLALRASLVAAALCATAAFAAVRGWPQMPGHLSLPGAMLAALGTGLALLPPKLRGVAGATRRERLAGLAPRYFGGLALVLLSMYAVFAAAAPSSWALADGVLAFTVTLTLAAVPLVLGLPWHKLPAGLLLAAGLLWR